MPWNGSGSFQRLFSWVADKAAAINITASRTDSDTDDIINAGLGNVLTRDGQGSATANLPMNNFRHTGVGNGAARNDYPALGQVQDGVVNWGIAGGTPDAMTLTLAPAVTALIDGQVIFLRAGGANTVTTPTVKVNGGAAIVITKFGGTPVPIGEYSANEELFLRYNAPNNRWERLNAHAAFTGGTITSVTNLSGAALNEALASIASASTMAIGAAAANSLLVTGTTGISAFDTVQAGTRRILIFQGVLLLTHNAVSFVLPNGGGNITTEAGDCSEWISLGSGNWQCVGYVRADGTPLSNPGGVPSGTVTDFAGLAAPAGWTLCGGQAISRTTFASLFNAITLQTIGNTTATSPIVTGIPSTTGMVAGMPISGPNFPATTILSVDSGTQIHLAVNATGTGVGSALQICPHGAGDGVTTFNVPDIRGRTTHGRDDMNGTAANRLTTGGSGILGTRVGASGGAETVTLTTATQASMTLSASLSTTATPTGFTSGSVCPPGAGGTGYITTNLDGIGPFNVGIGVSGSVSGTAVGSGGAHQNTAPAYVMNKIIKN
jgi:microcystin-dependent protein